MKRSKLSAVAAVVVSVVTVGCWIGPAEAQHRGGNAPAAPHPNVGGGAAHAPHPKAKAPAKAKAGAAKAAQKKKAQKNSTKVKHDEKKKDEHKKEEKKAHKEETNKKAHEVAKKAVKRSLRVADVPRFSDRETISLPHAVHHKLHQADHDYAGHRHKALGRIGSALSHLGASPTGGGSGRSNLPQSVSDATMVGARASLEEIRNRLAAGTAASHGHAHRAVEAAIGEIDLALSVR